jgi:nucleoside-diphosphate-sugar epimerase
VIALARSQSAAKLVEQLGAVAIGGDLDDAQSLDAAFGAATLEALVSLASLGFGHAPAIVAAAEAAGLGRSVFVSTTAIFTHLSARSKSVRRAAEDAIRESELRWTIIRPTMIYGTPRDRNMARLLAALKRSPVIPLPGGGRHLQQPVHVDDVASAVVNALETDMAIGHAYDIAGPKPLSLRAIVEDAAAAVGSSPRLVVVPLMPLVAGARLYEAVSRRPRLRAEQLERLAEDKAFDIGAAQADLRYNPRPFSRGIREEAALLG